MGKIVHLAAEGGNKVAADDEVAELQNPASALSKQIKALSAGDFAALERWRRNRVIWGLGVVDSTTPSSQATGAVPPTVLVTVGKGSLLVNGFPLNLFSDGDQAPFVDMELYDCPVLTVGGANCVACALVGADSGYGTTFQVWGAAAAGAGELPTDAEIVAALVAQGYGENFVKLAAVTVSRGSDLVITVGIDNEYRDW